ncbi:MAG: hypothetical protein QXO48_04130 [Desulfurococcaceae archaeon]
MSDLINKPRKTDYSDTEFRDLIRKVSDKMSRIYFTDVDFVAYIYDNRTGDRGYKLILEAKRKYQIKEGVYELQDSDKAVIGLSKRLGIPFVFVFYDQGKLTDEDEVLLVWLEREEDYINIWDFISKNLAKRLKVKEFKVFLRRLSREDFKDVWTSTF